jgi:hypothetical protein
MEQLSRKREKTASGMTGGNMARLSNFQPRCALPEHLAGNTMRLDE